MKFSCERDTLSEALSVAGRAASNPNRSPLRVLVGVRLHLEGDLLTITGTDLDLTISYQVRLNGHTDGVAVLQAKLASEIIKALPAGRVDVEIEGDEARITSGRSEFTMNTIPADEFPTLPDPRGGSRQTVTIEAGMFTQGVRQVVSAASTDEGRPTLTGVLLTAEGDGLRLVATDSYRLAKRDLPGTSVLNEGQSVLVPSRALNELTRVLSDSEQVTLNLGERDASFEVGDVVLSTRLIEGQFPNYRSLIPDSQPNTLTVGRQELLDAVKRVRLMARERETTPVRLEMSVEDGLRLRAITLDVGRADEQVDAKYEGENLVVAFNPEYLIQGLEATNGDEVTLHTQDALRPAVLRSVESTDYLYLLMPVRVS